MTHSRRVGQKVKLHKTSNSPRTIVDSESLFRNSVSVSECSVGIRSIQIIGVKRAETIRHITQPNLPTEFRYKNIKPKESSIKLLNIIYEPQPKCPCVAGEYHAYYFNNLLNQKMCLALWAWEKAWRERERVAPSTLIHHDKIQQRGNLKKIKKKKYFHSRPNVAASRGRKRKSDRQTERERRTGGRRWKTQRENFLHATSSRSVTISISWLLQEAWQQDNCVLRTGRASGRVTIHSIGASSKHWPTHRLLWPPLTNTHTHTHRARATAVLMYP